MEPMDHEAEAMMKTSKRRVALHPLGMALVVVLGLAAVAVANATAAPINIVGYGTVGPDVVTFSDIATGTFPSFVNYDGILVSGGVSFAERFVDQTLGAAGDNDTLGATASNPLALQVGLPGRNLSGGADLGIVGLYPCGPRGCADPNGYGEGSFAMLFPTLVSEVGLEAYFADTSANNLILQFFRFDGSLIDSVTVATGTGLGPLAFGFERDSSIRDIAGVSVYNTDPGGLAYDNITFNRLPSATTPEPGSLLLLLAGLAAARIVRRRKEA